MALTLEWVFPIGLGVLATLWMVFKSNAKFAPIKIRNRKIRR